MIESRDGAVRRHNTDERLTTTIAMAVAEARGEDAVDLPPLQSEIDLDALERLFESQNSTDADLRVGFRVEDCVVTIDDGVTVNVRRLPDQETEDLGTDLR